MPRKWVEVVLGPDEVHALELVDAGTQSLHASSGSGGTWMANEDHDRCAASKISADDPSTIISAHQLLTSRRARPAPRIG